MSARYCLLVHAVRNSNSIIDRLRSTMGGAVMDRDVSRLHRTMDMRVGRQNPRINNSSKHDAVILGPELLYIHIWCCNTERHERKNKRI